MNEQLALTLCASAVGFVSAAFFCVGAAFSSAEKIMLQAGTYWDFNEPLARALAAQRAQYVTGALLLLVAFGLQVLAAVGSATSPAGLPQWLDTWPRLLFAAVATSLALALLVCRTTEKATMRKVWRLQAAEETKASQP